MGDSRVSYPEMKSSVLENYWEACRDHGPATKAAGVWELAQISSDVYDGYAGGSGSFDSPLEYLMLEVISLVLSCWYPDQADFHRARIAELMRDNDIGAMLSSIPFDEAEVFKHDLKILRII